MFALYLQLKKKNFKKNIEFGDYYSSRLENSNISREDLSTKCRICVQKGTISVYDEDNSQQVVEALQIFANISINEEDGYSNRLCTTCFKFIKSAILFRKTALLSEKIIKQPVKEEVSNILEHSDDDRNYSDGSVCDSKEHSECWTKKYDHIKKEKKERVKYSAKVTCHVCNKVINRSYYKEHLTMHDPDHKKYVCDVCGKSFRLRCAYHNHSLRHRTDFPYKCQFCPYRGRYSELLKTHMRTHTGDYRYMCTECPARFLFKSNLNSHMLKHKEPEFKCIACKRAFHTKLLLQRHVEADHLGIKNHVCNVCGKAFGYRNAMMKHQRHVHKREKMLFGRMPAYLQAENAN